MNSLAHTIGLTGLVGLLTAGWLYAPGPPMEAAWALAPGVGNPRASLGDASIAADLSGTWRVTPTSQYGTHSREDWILKQHEDGSLTGTVDFSVQGSLKAIEHGWTQQEEFGFRLRGDLGGATGEAVYEGMLVGKEIRGTFTVTANGAQVAKADFHGIRAESSQEGTARQPALTGTGSVSISASGPTWRRYLRKARYQFCSNPCRWDMTLVEHDDGTLTGRIGRYEIADGWAKGNRFGFSTHFEAGRGSFKVIYEATIQTGTNRDNALERTFEGTVTMEGTANVVPFTGSLRSAP